eukprot:3160267-Rhodomonas_salina.2
MREPSTGDGTVCIGCGKSVPEIAYRTPRTEDLVAPTCVPSVPNVVKRTLLSTNAARRQYRDSCMRSFVLQERIGTSAARWMGMSFPIT